MLSVDDMFENLGIDRDIVDQKDILDAYDEAYKTLSRTVTTNGSRWWT